MERLTRRSTIAIAAASLLCMVIASPASAGTVSVSGSTIEFVANPGESNVVAVTGLSSTTARFNDTGGPLSAGAGCTAVDANTADCSGSAISLDLGDLGDGASAIGPDADGGTYDLPMTILGGDGNDSIQGGLAADLLDGGPGADFLWSSGAADTFIGGDGSDVVLYHGELKRVKIDLRKLYLDGYHHGGRVADDRFNDRYATDIESFFAGYGNDKLFGDSEANGLLGSSGNDTIKGYGGNDGINGGGGHDSMDGGDGDDVMNSDDNIRENVRCGDGFDSFQIDSLDRTSHCELQFP